MELDHDLDQRMELEVIAESELEQGVDLASTIEQRVVEMPGTCSNSTPETTIASASQIKGFKLVGDNVDGTINPRYVRADQQAEDYHYFHSYAVLISPV